MKTLLRSSIVLLAVACTLGAQPSERKKVAEGDYVMRPAAGVKAPPELPNGAVMDHWTMWRTPDGYEVEIRTYAPNRAPLRSWIKFDSSLQTVGYRLTVDPDATKPELECVVESKKITCHGSGMSGSLAVDTPYVIALSEEAMTAMDLPWLTQCSAIVMKKRPGAPVRYVYTDDVRSEPNPNDPDHPLPDRLVPRVVDDPEGGKYLGEEEIVWNGQKIRADKVALGNSEFAWLAPSGVLLKVSMEETEVFLENYKEEEPFLLKK